MRNKNTHRKRNKLIYEYYCTRWGECIRHNEIIKELHERYYLQPKTLNDIVRMMRKEAQAAQPELPLTTEEGTNDNK